MQKPSKNSRTKELKVINLQLDPKHSEPEKNQKKAEEFIEKCYNGPIDMILMPEFALIGYVFDKKEDLFKQSEYQNGWHYQKLSEMAKKYKCYVVCGYCEKSKKNIVIIQILIARNLRTSMTLTYTIQRC